MKIKKLGLVLVVAGLVGCATHPSEVPSQHVSPLLYQQYTCNQIILEMDSVNRKMQESYTLAADKADGDEGQMAIGMILFWPALFFLEGGDGPEVQAYARAKGEYEALEKMAILKECNKQLMPEMFAPPKPEKPTSGNPYEDY